jgi:uncharacterized protein
MPVTALMAALLLPLYLILTFRVINVRRSQKISLGDGGDKAMTRRIRVHANFVETVPFALILLASAESLKAPVLALYAAGALLIAGRLMHAYGTSQSPDVLPLRGLGMVCTLTSMIVAATLGGLMLGGVLR